jgi:hypothetical protein
MWSEETHIWLRLLCKEIKAVTWFTIQHSPATHIIVENVGHIFGADLSFEPLWNHSINLPDSLWNKLSLVSGFRTPQAHQLRRSVDSVIQKRGLLMQSALSAAASFILSTKWLKALRQRLSVVRF